LECPKELETLEDNLVLLQLNNALGHQAYLDPSDFASEGPNTLMRKLAVTVIINSSEEKIMEDEHNGFDFDFKEVRRFFDEESGLEVCQGGSFNRILFQMGYEIDECNHSNIEVKLVP